ncbi:HNH endonuclease [Lacticaseibacillus rhamnosus]|uniref:HNH endonuclease n=1 Tax=Lacticaseibacillus rhamnosus TaxID=47715 RepID=UPI002FBD91D7
MCYRIIPINERYCPVHQAQHEQEWQAKKDAYRKSKLGKAVKAQQAKQYDQNKRDQEATAFYHSKQWQAVRDYVYARDGATCQVCGNILGKKAIDHVVPLKLCKDKQALDSSNLWTLCYKCHYRKTKLEQTIAKQSNGDTKLRHLNREWWTKVLREKKEDK